MKNFNQLNCFIFLVILSIAQVLFLNPAQAYIYDDFSSSGIDSSLWVDTTPTNDCFSQPGDGFLYFYDSMGGQRDQLRSYDPVTGAFAVAMQYSNFQATNDTQAGAGLGSSIILRLQDGSNSVSMLEYKNNGGLGFQAISWIDDTRTSLNYVHTDVNSGWLGMVYNGISGPAGEVNFWYNSGAGWMWLASVSSNFSQAPFFSVLGSDTYGDFLAFQVDRVEVSPIPLPASVLLLGTGLLGLAGLGRKLRKS